jgi:hypothetical protein
MTHARRLCLSLALVTAAAASLPTIASAEPAVGIVSGSNVLAGFDTASPGAVASLEPVTGLAAGERILGLDFRHLPLGVPQPPQLFALGVTPGGANDALRLYTIDPGTAVATLVSPTTVPVPAGAGYGFDFNPTVDRIRVVNSADQNLRLNPNTGALAGSDTAINPAGLQISGVAYDRVNLPPASGSTTTLHAIGRTSSELGRIGGIDGVPSPNTGQFTAVGALGITLDASTTTDFDVSFGGTAFATATTGGVQGLYRLDLGTGAASLVGSTAVPLSALAIIPTTTLAFAAPAVTVSESAGAATVSVTRGGSEPGSITPSTTVAWSASGGPSGTLSFAPGETSKSFAVPIADDAVDAPDEAVTLALSSPSFPATLGTPATATLTIADDDGPPSLRLSRVPRSISYKKLLKRGVRFRVTPSEPVALEATLSGTTRKARLSRYNLALAKRTLRLAPGVRTVKLKPSRKAIRRPRHAVRLRLRVVATDAAGQRAVKRKTLRLKRR